MKKDKVLSLIGLARKAGKIAAGEYQTEQAVHTGRAALVIVAEDASGNTVKKFFDMCHYRHVPVIRYSSKELLGNAAGYEMRAVMAVLDTGFAASIRSQTDSNSITGAEQQEEVR